MIRVFKRVSIFCVCIILLAASFLTPVAYAATGVYELTFDNLFIFEQWANHANLKVYASDGSTTSTLTTNIENGSFVLTNNTASTEAYTAFSMSSIGAFYSMPVEESTEYVLSYVANGTTTSVETFVFYFDTQGNYVSLENKFATPNALNEWTFTTGENIGYIQVRFDNNSPNTNMTVSDIRICSKEAYEYTKNHSYSRKTFTYTSGATYGNLLSPERDGKVFAGWFTEPDGKGEKITDSTIMAPASKSLYSKWDPVVKRLETVSEPIKENYCLGEKLNTKGLVLEVTYPDDTKENIDEGFVCSPEILTHAGTQIVTVAYGGQTAEFQVNVSDSKGTNILVNNSEYSVTEANNKYALNYNGSAFNQYVITYSSDAYVKGELNFNETIEEFFLEPAQNGTFSGYIDGFLEGTTQTEVANITFESLNKEFADFTLFAIDFNKASDISKEYGMVYLNDSYYKIGIDLDWGGALTYMEDLSNDVVAAKSNQDTSLPIQVGFSSDYAGTFTSGGINIGSVTIGGTTKNKYDTKGNVNLINAHDTGRLVQQSYYGTGSYPYEPGMYGDAVWNYNPVQGGNLYNEASKIVDLKVTGNEIYVKCRPLDWAKEKQNITPSYMEAWYTLEDGMVRATCRFVDFSGYPSVTTTQELPAFYCVEPLNDFVYYSGGEAWSDSNTRVTESDLVFWGEEAGADQTFVCNENWAAYIGDDADSFGIGLYCPGQTNMFTGVFQRDTLKSLQDSDEVASDENLIPGQPAANHGSTSYIAAVDTLYFQSYKPISYCYYMTTGNVDTIRENFRKVAQTDVDICDATNTNGFCDMCGKCTAPELNEEGVYEISNAGELHWFSNFVNKGNVDADAVLVCDITDNEGVLTGYGILAGNTSAFRTWKPIGNATYKYNGSFDGQGYTVNGLYMNDSTISYGGLFGYTASNAEITEVGIDDSYFKGSQYIGSISGYNDGKISNSYSFYVILQGSSYAGGITGYNNGVIENCYNTGVVNATGYAGGIAGDKTNSSNISNCYYLSNCATDGSGTVESTIGSAKAIEEFANGEVAYLLQSANTEQLWGQKTNVSGSGPIFDKNDIYRVNAVENADDYVLAGIGDTDEDEDIDQNDYQHLVNSVLSGEELVYKDMLKSDIDGDGYLDVIDCAFMYLMVSGLLDKVDVYLKGDYDCDGVPFTKEDVVAIKKGLVNQGTLNTRQKYACDLNSDGVLDINDKNILSEQNENASESVFKSMEEFFEKRNTKVNVIILAGQSNAYGASPLTQAVRNAIGSTDFSNIKIKYTNINSDDGTNNWRVYYSNSAFETYRLGIGGQADAWFGPEAGIAYHLATNEATKDETWYIIKTTAAGTYLGGHWLHDTTGSYLNANNSENIKNNLGVYLADGMINLVGADLAELTSIYGVGNVNIRAFMWMQGESDSCVQEWANQYGELQNILVNRVRNELGSWDNDSKIPFIDGAIAAYKEGINTWTYSDTVNTAKANNATHWFVPKNTTGNVINQTTAGVYLNTSGSTTQLANSLWVDTSTCLSKLENNNENGENDGAHYCGESMLDIGMWFAMGISVFP